MYNLLKLETRFMIETKKNYFFQSFVYYIERVIFIIGMALLLFTSDNTINMSMILKLCFWFSTVNAFAEMAKRIESEIRLKQFQHCYDSNTYYWKQIIIRLIPILFDSLFIMGLSFLCIGPFIDIVIDISLIGSCFYILSALIQYSIFNCFFILLILIFKRVQAVLGLVENVTFFYSGMVLINNNFQFILFRVMDKILYGNFYYLLYFLVIVLIEAFLLKLGISYVNCIIKKG